MQAILRAAIIVAALAVSGAAFADQGTNNGKSDQSNASSCGQAHAAQADVYGNYGFLGDVGGTPGYHNGATGQDPGATGYNNSHTSCQTNPS